MTSFGRAAHGGGDGPERRPRRAAAPPSASRSPQAGLSGRPARTSRRRGGSRSGPARRACAAPSARSPGWPGTRRPGTASRAAGRRARRSAIHSRSCAAIRELLSLYMRDNSSATLVIDQPLSARPAAGLWWGLLGVAAFSFTVPFTRVAVARAVAAVHRIGPGRCRGRPRRMRPRPDPAAPAPRRPVGARSPWSPAGWWSASRC